MTLLRPLAAALAVVLGLSFLGAAPAAAKERRTVVTITHAPTAPTAIIGSGLGTVRTYYVPIAVSGKQARTGYMSGTLTTIATGLEGGREARAARHRLVRRAVHLLHHRLRGAGPRGLLARAPRVRWRTPPARCT